MMEAGETKRITKKQERKNDVNANARKTFLFKIEKHNTFMQRNFSF